MERNPTALRVPTRRHAHPSSSAILLEGRKQAETESPQKMAPEVGFEPTTNRLTADRSTTELLRSVVGEDTNPETGRFKQKSPSRAAMRADIGRSFVACADQLQHPRR